MSDGIPYADIVIMALIAGFILLRLRSILGSKSDDDTDLFTKPPFPSAADKAEPIVQLDEKSLKPKIREETDTYLALLGAGAVADTLSAIKAKDPLFTATQFLQGAKGAFEMVFDAFAKGDRQTLKMLLSDTLFQQFSKEIDARAAQENKTENTLVSLEAKDITQATFTNNTAQLGVRFLSEQVHLVRGGAGEIVEGDPSEIHHVEDHWLFERDTTSKNPNWKIIET